MALAYRNGTQQGGGSSTNLVGTKPALTVNNDILIAFLYREASDAVTISGWTQLGNPLASQPATTPGYHVRAYWKRAASEPASWQWNFAFSWAELHIIALSGGLLSGTPVEGAASTVNANQNDEAISPTVTPSVLNTWLVTHHVSFDSGTPVDNWESAGGAGVNAPAGMTRRLMLNNLTSTEARADASATGTRTAISTTITPPAHVNPEFCVGLSLLVKPDVGGQPLMKPIIVRQAVQRSVVR